jgi:hypothetical protein
VAVLGGGPNHQHRRHPRGRGTGPGCRCRLLGSTPAPTSPR